MSGRPIPFRRADHPYRAGATPRLSRRYGQRQPGRQAHDLAKSVTVERGSRRIHDQFEREAP